ncbi:MAG: sigma-54-dependent Fis family transcriptional regulator [Acidobacteria bacterium]|nr:sigma-54-dependent Fis family transcriptional regulator [Acidobacteriota bacterium]
MFNILVVDDDEQMQFFLREALERQGYAVVVKGSAEDALEALRADSFDLMLLDVRLPGMSGLVAVEEILKVDARIPIIVMTAHGTRDSAIEAMRRGAYDYFTKPFRLDEMEIIIRRALEKRKLMTEIERLRDELASAPGHGRMVGASRAMTEVFHLIERSAPTDSTVLIIGESGVGKELVAEAIHQHSSRKERPFVKLNCAAIPETLLESELFGYEKGAFTGAISRKLGKFELADGGTLLLDEIGDMALSTQAKILRVLQERELERVGGTSSIRVDVRIMASTNKDLMRSVKDGRFRDDLYFRLNVITINVPPLRERREEIPTLVDHFLAEANSRLGRTIRRVSPDAMAALMGYDWPGNIRELKNAIERSAVVTDGEVVSLSSLPQPIRPAGAGATNGSGSDQLSGGITLDEKIAQLERAFVIDALAKAGGVQAAAARLLGVTERSVWHLVKKHRIEVEKIKERAQV